jgi:hypothetical protein
MNFAPVCLQQRVLLVSVAMQDAWGVWNLAMFFGSPVAGRACQCAEASICLFFLCQIDETAATMEEQLAQINADRAELLAYQALDKKQRGIEYALLDRELTSARKELAKVGDVAQKQLLTSLCAPDTVSLRTAQLQAFCVSSNVDSTHALSS